jgi:hypothetical protein
MADERRLADPAQMPAHERPTPPSQDSFAWWQPARDVETTMLPRIMDAPEEPALITVPRQREAETELLPRVADTLAPEPRPPSVVRHAGRWDRTVAMPVLGLAPELLTLSAIGVVLVAVAYVGGRVGAAYAGPLYWAGHVLVYTPVVFRLLSRKLTGFTESFLLVIGLAVNQYLLKWLYSPDQLRFPDELQHWLSTSIVLDTGRLFRPNTALPVAAHFPGLEEIGAAVASLTGLSVTASGLLVAGILHLVFVGALFMLVRSAGGTPPLAGATCAIYATALHYLFFDSMYLYQTAALPFLVLAIWATRRWWRREPGFLPYAVVGLVSVAVVTVSHHITAFAMVGALSLLALADLVLPARPRRWSTVVLAGAAAVLVTTWVVFVATEVVDYLAEPVNSLISGLSHLFSAGGSAQSLAPANPLWELAVEAVGLLCLFVLLIRAGWTAIRTRERDPWQWALIAGSALFFGTSALRFVGADGPELAGRAATFTYIPMSMLAAATIVEWRRSLRPRLWPGPLGRLTVDARWARPAPLGAAMATLLMVAARAGGWPPYWEQLPGRYLVSGFERSVDAQGVAAARWSRTGLDDGTRVAAGTTGITLLSTYGRHDTVGASLYEDPVWGLRDQQLLQSQAVDYLWVDLRMSQQLPADGAYYPGDPDTGRHTVALPRAGLTKFDGVPGVSRVYDSGDIQIYDMRGA